MIKNEILEELWAVKDKLSHEAANGLHDYCDKINAAAKEKGFILLQTIPPNIETTFAVAEESTSYKT